MRKPGLPFLVRFLVVLPTVGALVRAPGAAADEPFDRSVQETSPAKKDDDTDDKVGPAQARVEGQQRRREIIIPKDEPSPLTAPFDEVQAKAAQEAWAKAPGKSSPVETNSIGMELVLIPPGKSTMGTLISGK
jgi:formylglycine-generating enzyme required for sulfatase activity